MKRRASGFVKLLVLSFFILSNLSCLNELKKNALEEKVEHALEFSRMKLKKEIKALKGNTSEFPHEATVNKNKSWITKNCHSWGSGYFPGMMWYMYEDTNEDFWKEKAMAWTAGLEPEKDNDGHHDIGLIIGCSYGNGYRLTQNQHYRSVILDAAKTLASRFNPSVGCTRSWGKMANDKTFTVIIDNMVCLELLFMGAEAGGPEQWREIAICHAKNTVKNHIRQDGSTYHLVIYNPITGGIIERKTHQGFAKESCWARGQAWAIHGFTMMSRETGEQLFLHTAQRVADYFINNLPDDYVPYWDFRLPDIKNAKKDSSAAAIAASGLFELSTLIKDKEKSKKYFNTACRILHTLCSEAYLSEGTNSPAILLRMTYGCSDAVDMNTVNSWIWGDYYFVEAMMRYKRIVSGG